MRQSGGLLYLIDLGDDIRADDAGYFFELGCNLVKSFGIGAHAVGGKFEVTVRKGRNIDGVIMGLRCRSFDFRTPISRGERNDSCHIL